MTVDFRGHPMFQPGFNSPTRFEADVYDCEVWGQIPSDIEGTFYRVLAGPLSSQAEAATLCTQLRQAGGSCQVARR